jgi:hypothetical protein
MPARRDGRLSRLFALLATIALSASGVPGERARASGVPAARAAASPAHAEAAACQADNDPGLDRGSEAGPAGEAAGEILCEGAVFPACGGACPPYNTCQAVRVGTANFCACVGQRATCGVLDPLCGGLCPPGLVCVGDVFGVGRCACVVPRRPGPRWRHLLGPVEGSPGPRDTDVSTTTVPVTTSTSTLPEEPCAGTAYPVCGGTCGTGEVCVPHGDATGADGCRCFPAPETGAPCGDADAPACDGACPPGTACLAFDRRRVALLVASGCSVDRDVPLCPRPLPDAVRARLKEIRRQTEAAGGTNGGACVCLDVAGAPCGLLGGPECGGECPPEAPLCRQTEAGCACVR